MRVFDGMGMFAQFLAKRAGEATALTAAAVGSVAFVAYERAVRLYGDSGALQPDLAPGTVTMRTNRWGYYRRPSVAGPNETLLWTGGLRKELEFHHDGLIAGYGSANPVQLYHEIGTARIPPRPLLRIAAQEARESGLLVTRYYAARMIGVNVEGGGNILNQFTGVLKKSR